MDIIPTRGQTLQSPRDQKALAVPSGVHHVGAAPAAVGITGKEILGILRKRMWMIIITSLIITLVVLTITLVWWIYWPLYTATAFLEVIPPQTSGIVRTNLLVNKDIMDSLLRSKARVVRSENVLQSATKDNAVRNTNWFQIDTDDVVKRLSEDITVVPQAGTSHILISMTAGAASEKEKNDLAEIVNAVALAAVAESSTRLGAERARRINNLRAELDSLQRDLRDIRNRAETARRTASADNLQQRQSVVNIQLQAMTTQMVRLQIAKAEADAALKALTDQEAIGQLESIPDVQQSVEMDVNLRQLKSRIMDFETELQNASRKLGPDHRTIKMIETRLESMKNKAAEREKMLATRAIRWIKTRREADSVSMTAQLMQVQQKFNEINARVSDLEANLTMLKQLAQREKEISWNIQALDKQLLNERLLAVAEEEVRLLIPAIKPREISMPRWSIMVPIGIMLGLGIGFGVAFLVEFIDTSIRSPSDIYKRVDLPLLGMVAHTDDLEEEKEIEELRLAFLTHPNSLIGEAFRQIRTCLLFSGPASQRRSLLVTSPLPEDGRSTVTMNLAAAIAHDGRRVLVVDANFRQPVIPTLFPQCPDGGLSSALVGQGDWRDLVYEVQPNLHVLSAGVLPPNPAELLGSDEMRNILVEMLDLYDQVIIDGPPCLVVTDSAILATLVDGVIMTVRAGANTYGAVQRTRDVLLRVGAHIIGVVLNGVRVTAGGYLRKNYETFYEYHELAQLSAEETIV